MMTPTQAADDQQHFGFMGPLLGRAKKVLFPDGDAAWPDVVSVAISSSSLDNPPGVKKSKSRARRARLAASTSSLASISSRCATDGSVGSHSLSRATAGLGKENKAPRSKSFHRASSKRGSFQRMDSLASSLSNELAVKLESNRTDPPFRSKSFQTRRGVNVHRRKTGSSLQSRDCSLSSCSERTMKYEPAEQGIVIKSKTGQNSRKEVGNSKHAHGMNRKNAYKCQSNNSSASSLTKDASSHALSMKNASRSRSGNDVSKHALIKKDTDKRHSNISSASSLMNDSAKGSMAEIGKPLSLEREANHHRKPRRRGRCNHPMSSLVQEGEFVTNKTKSKQSSGLSSLMSLTASMQKTQKTSSLAQKKAIKKNTKSRQAKLNISQSHSTTNASDAATQEVQPIENINITALVNDVDALNIGGDPMNCSTPLTIRHRAKSGSITSPPGFLHRFSTLPSDLFQDRSPLPDLNPNLKKRSDSKKTPGKVIALAASNCSDPSPLATGMSISPDARACSIPAKSSQGHGENEKDDTCAGESEIPDDTSHALASPRIIITSSSFIPTPNKEVNALSGARSNLFSSNAGEQDVGPRGMSGSAKRVLRSAVDAVEPTTPVKKSSGVTAEGELSDSPRVSIRSSCVMDVEMAPPIPSNKTEASNASPQNKEKDVAKSKKKQGEIESAKIMKGAVRVTTKEVNEAIQPRRSSRQSKPTDRLTIISWNGKKKKGGKLEIDRKVQFDNSTNFDESVDDIIEDANDSPPSLHEQSFKEQTLDVLNKNTDDSIIAPSSEHAIVNKDRSNKWALDTSSEIAEGSVSSNACTAQKTIEANSSEGCQWTDGELRTLRKLQKQTDPTSCSLWHEVAIKIGSKTSSECQSKWQSMVATPKIRKSTKKKDVGQPMNLYNSLKNPLLDAFSADDAEEDDLFNSSPYREEDIEDGHYDNAPKFDSINFGSSVDTITCFKQNATSNYQQDEPSAQKFQRKGYRSYVETLRKDMLRAEKQKKTQKLNQVLNSHSQKIHADSGNEEHKMSGQLLPNGTVKITMQEECQNLEDTDDIWDDEEDNEV